MNPLVELQKFGQSPWHDNIRRDLLTSGKLAKMIGDGDITGLTSNPTIFEQAIGHSHDYDNDLITMAKAGKSAGDIFEALAVDDIRHAAMLFAPVFERTKGVDGYVSIEVSPNLAHDTAATIGEALRLWQKVDKPNLMVKIPATVEGVPAIEHCIAEGLNINVTLIFSLERYNDVMDAYINGLAKRAKAGRDISNISSVASFFVSRVDTAIDPVLDAKIKEGAKGLEDLKGKAAIANAKLAYQAFLKKFAEPAFSELAKKGARRQRPLWASTSTKNPAYRDVVYVEALVGKDTVDTMPPATIDAFRDHGKARPDTVEEDVPGAHKALARLAEAGVDMSAVIRKLEIDGVASFAKSFDTLIAAVDQRRAEAVKA